MRQEATGADGAETDEVERAERASLLRPRKAAPREAGGGVTLF